MAQRASERLVIGDFVALFRTLIGDLCHDAITYVDVHVLHLHDEKETKR